MPDTYRFEHNPTFDKDPRNFKCGHNFSPNECPYPICGYRDALEMIKEKDAVTTKLSEGELYNAPSPNTNPQS